MARRGTGNGRFARDPGAKLASLEDPHEENRGSSPSGKPRGDDSISSFDETPFRPDRPSNRLVNPGSKRARPLEEGPPTIRNGDRR